MNSKVEPSFDKQLILHLVLVQTVIFFCCRLVKGYQRINKFGNVIAYFTMREWKFSNDNIQSLWNRMKKHDQDLFEFDIRRINWDMYFSTYTKGTYYLIQTGCVIQTKTVRCSSVSAQRSFGHGSAR